MSTNRVVVTGYGLTSPIAFMKEKSELNPLQNLMLQKFQFLMLVKSKTSHSINIL